MAFLEYRPETTLFHYTSVAGFKGIIDSKNLWFSDLLKTNDPREIHLGHEMVTDAITFVRHNDFPGERGLPISVLAGKLASYIEKGGILSCSFSHIGDALPMWRAYGDDYQGIAIGFRPTAIIDMPIRIQRVKYLPEASAENLIELVREFVPPLVHSHAGGSPEDWISATVEIMSAIVSCKHNTWDYEKEIRGTHAAVGVDGSVDMAGNPIPAYEYPDGEKLFSDLKTRKSENGEVRYLSLPFGKYKDGKHHPRKAIARAIIGPKSPLEKEEVAEMLEAAGFEGFEVVNSDCLIR